MRTGKALSVPQGLDIYMLGSAGLFGACILSVRKENELLARFRTSFVKETAGLIRTLPDIRAARAAYRNGAVCVQMLGEDGVFAGLWRLAESLHCGLETDLRRIPVRQETIEICEFFGLNPYELHSGGSFLAAAAKPELFVSAMEKRGLVPKYIGHTTGGNDRIVQNRDIRRYLTRPEGGRHVCGNNPA